MVVETKVQGGHGEDVDLCGQDSQTVAHLSAKGGLDLPQDVLDIVDLFDTIL